MSESLESKRKKIAFLDGIINEKAEAVAALERDAAKLRKKNGAFAGAEVDLAIYRANMKISAEKKAISDCKREAKRLKDECADILLKDYAEHRAYKDRQKLRAEFSALYGGKSEIIDETESAECVAVSAITTSDKRMAGKAHKLVSAGVKTSAGKIVKLPRVEIYELDSNKPDGEVFAFIEPKTVTLKTKKERRQKGIDFKFIKDNALIGGLLLAVAALGLVANLTRVAETISASAGGYAFTLLCAIGLIIYFLFNVNSVTFKRNAVALLIAGGVTLAESAINFSAAKLVFPIVAIVIGGAFSIVKPKTSSIKTSEEIVLPLGVIFGAATGAATGAAYPSSAFGRVWLVAVLAIVGILGILSAARLMLKRPAQISLADFFASLTASAYITFGIKIGFGFIGISACVLGVVYAAAEVGRLMKK